MTNAAQDLLLTPTSHLSLRLEDQMSRARKTLGEAADDAAVKQLAFKYIDAAKAIRAELEKPLGTSNAPFPMFGTQRVEGSDDTVLDQDLSVIASDANPMKIYSARPYNEVMAMAYSDMPVPSMLPLFFRALERRRPESRNRTQMLIGDPGHGKSFMGSLMGRMRSKKPVEVFDCGGKNMNDLLFEMVLDFGAGDALPVAIDKRLKAGVLQPLSQGLLKQLDADFLSQDADGNITAIDWNGLKAAGTEKVQDAFRVLTQISKTEGLDNAGGNALGMNSQFGPLIRWFIEGREGVLDEYNKSREGTDNALQTVLQFMNGEIDVCTVENPLKNKDSTSGPSFFTFRREDMPAGFFVTFTGNKTEDGITTRSLNKSVYSRLSPDTLPDPDKADWQHRICQMMVGLPISTLYAVFKEQADKDPAAFGQWLLTVRREKAKIEGVPVPELQETLILNWQRTQRATSKLAEFYYKWATLTDINKITGSAHASLLDEVDEEYGKKEGVDFRKVKQHLEESMPIRPAMLPADIPVYMDFRNFLKAPVLKEGVDEAASLSFGGRLVKFLEDTVYEKTEAVGKHKLYAELCKAMKEFEFRDRDLKEATRTGQKSVEDCLNISAFNDADPVKQATMLRKVLCDYLRRVEPEIVASDEEIFTTKTIQNAMAWLKSKNTAETKEIFVVNRDHDTLTVRPFAPAHIEDYALHEHQGTTAALDEKLTLDDLVSHDDLLATLAMPVVNGQNLAAVWDTNLRLLLEGTAANGNGAGSEGKKAQDYDHPLLTTENRSPSGVALTTLTVAFNDASGEMYSVPVHIVRNAALGKTLIVSERAPTPALLSAFREAGVLHVDRSETNAVVKIEAALREVMRNAPATTRSVLANAFKLRNTTSLPAGGDTDLASLLADKGVVLQQPKYLVRGRAL